MGWTEGGRQGEEDGKAGRGDFLIDLVCGPDARPPHEESRGPSGMGDGSMGRSRRGAGAHRQRIARDLDRSEAGDERHGRGDVEDGVIAPHLVEVKVRSLPVNLTLSAGEEEDRPPCETEGGPGDAKGRKTAQHRLHRPAFPARRRDAHPLRHDRAPALPTDDDPDPEAAGDLCDHPGVAGQIDEGGDPHVAGETAHGVHVQVTSQRLRARAAKAAAPYPLSMFITARPSAQEASMVASAVRPPSATP